MIWTKALTSLVLISSISTLAHSRALPVTSNVCHGEACQDVGVIDLAPGQLSGSLLPRLDKSKDNELDDVNANRRSRQLSSTHAIRATVPKTNGSPNKNKPGFNPFNPNPNDKPKESPARPLDPFTWKKSDPTASPVSKADPTADSTAASPTAADPTAAEPTAAEPTAAEPTAAGPTAEPTAASPTAADPTAADPTAAEPTASKPSDVSGTSPDNDPSPEATSPESPDECGLEKRANNACGGKLSVIKANRENNAGSTTAPALDRLNDKIANRQNSPPPADDPVPTEKVKEFFSFDSETDRLDDPRAAPGDQELPQYDYDDLLTDQGIHFNHEGAEDILSKAGIGLQDKGGFRETIRTGDGFSNSPDTPIAKITQDEMREESALSITWSKNQEVVFMDRSFIKENKSGFQGPEAQMSRITMAVFETRGVIPSNIQAIARSNINNKGTTNTIDEIFDSLKIPADQKVVEVKRNDDTQDRMDAFQAFHLTDNGKATANLVGGNAGAFGYRNIDSVILSRDDGFYHALEVLGPAP